MTPWGRNRGDEKQYAVSARLSEEQKAQLTEICERYQWNYSQTIVACIRYCHEHKVLLNPALKEDA